MVRKTRLEQYDQNTDNMEIWEEIAYEGDIEPALVPVPKLPSYREVLQTLLENNRPGPVYSLELRGYVVKALRPYPYCSTCKTSIDINQLIVRYKLWKDSKVAHLDCALPSAEQRYKRRNRIEHRLAVRAGLSVEQRREVEDNVIVTLRDYHNAIDAVLMAFERLCETEGDVNWTEAQLQYYQMRKARMLEDADTSDPQIQKIHKAIERLSSLNETLPKKVLKSSPEPKSETKFILVGLSLGEKFVLFVS